jgi:hypothetical protein
MILYGRDSSKEKHEKLLEAIARLPTPKSKSQWRRLESMLGRQSPPE